MSDKTESGMTMSTDAEATLLAVKARIAAIPAGKTLIDDISDGDWADTEAAGWMINAGSDAANSCAELDFSDKMSAQVA